MNFIVSALKIEIFYLKTQILDLSLKMGRSDNTDLSLSVPDGADYKLPLKQALTSLQLLSDLHTVRLPVLVLWAFMFLYLGVDVLHLFSLAQLSNPFRHSAKPRFYPPVKSCSDQVLISSSFRFGVFFFEIWCQEGSCHFFQGHFYCVL